MDSQSPDDVVQRLRASLEQLRSVVHRNLGISQGVAQLGNGQLAGLSVGVAASAGGRGGEVGEMGVPVGWVAAL